MRKILFLAEAVSLAHVGRPLMLAEWAKKNAFESHFACSNEGLGKTNAILKDLKLHSLETISGQLFYDRINQGCFFYTPAELKSYVKQEIEIIKKVDPDLIVSDFRLTSAISAELMNKPLLNLSNAYWSPTYSCQFPPPEYGIFKFLPQRSSDLIFNIIRPIIFKTFGKELNQIRIHFGLQKKADFRELYTDGTFTAYLDLPDFVPLQILPDNHFYLGPVIWSPEVQSSKIFLSDKNYVYITMGSSGENKLLPEIIKAVLKLKYKVVLSGINSLEKKALIHEFPQLASNSIIEPLIPAEQILKNCLLTICHGGSGTVYQSLKHGTPILCFPKNPDQSLVSMSLENNNLGRRVKYKTDSKINIESMILECISNGELKTNAINYSKKINSWNTENHWKRFLSKFNNEVKLTKEIA